MRMTKIFAFIMIFMALATLFASPSFAEKAKTTKQNGKRWILGDVLGQVTRQTNVSLKDDFYSAINKSWLAENHLKPSDISTGTFSLQSDKIRDDLIELLDGKDLKDKEFATLQLYFRQLCNMERRNKEGLKPLVLFIKEIEDIKTLDELSAYTLRLDKPANGLSGEGASTDLKNASVKSVYISATDLSLDDADEYKNLTDLGKRLKASREFEVSTILKRMGKTEEEVKKLLADSFKFENLLAPHIYGLSVTKQADIYEKIYNLRTLEDLKKAAGAYPLDKLLEPYVKVGVTRFVLEEPKWLEAMARLYTQENLELMKAYLICNTVSALATSLDQASIDTAMESAKMVYGKDITYTPKERAYYRVYGKFSMNLGRLYSEHFASPATKKKISDLIDKVVAIYDKRLANATWLSEQTRKTARAKLASLKKFVCFPEDWSDFDITKLVLKSEAEGGDVISNSLKISEFYALKNIREANDPVKKDKWKMSPATVNACYSPLKNSITITSGIARGDFYDENNMARIMGGIGTIIAHEITHAFDKHGSQFDKNGNMKNWWTEQDRKEFEKRSSTVRDYFGSIEVMDGKFLDGELSLGENVADLGGVSCMLELAKDYKDFDYKEFFETYARIWKKQMPKEVIDVILKDPHAPGYVRTNACVQQFEEFYKAFDVHEGDGMYLPPQNRVAVW